jgi:hypothetical protein
MAGLALSLLTPFALLLLLPFILYWLDSYRSRLRDPRRWPGVAAKLGAWFAFELALAAVLIASSLRYRKLVL